VVGFGFVETSVRVKERDEIAEILQRCAFYDNASHDPQSRRVRVTAMKLVRVVLFGLLFLFVMVNVHETGHTLLARLFGDSSAHYVLYQADGTGTCMGCNLYDSSRMGALANVVVNLGGVIFTQLLCWGAILLLASGAPAILERWMLLTVIGVSWLGDAILQLVQGVQANIPQQLPRGPESTYTDYAAVVWFIRDQTGAAASDLKTALVLATIGYSALLLLATRWALRRRRR
jgi:hypothetical protein